MRFALPLIIAGALSAATPAGAQSHVGDDVYLLAGASVKPVAMAAWADGAVVKSAMGADATKAPVTAVKYSAATAPWATGRVRVLTFSAATGGVLHQIADETLLYMLSGTAQVDVAGKPVMLAQGDVVSGGTGSLRNAGAAADAVVVTWNVKALSGDMTPTHIKGADVKEGGGGGLMLKRYEFPGNSVRAVKLAAGTKTNKNSAKTDSLIYVTSGPMKFHENGKDFTVTAGDFIREVAGLEHFWDVTENSSFVTTSALPIGAGPIDPAKATDRPPEK